MPKSTNFQHGGDLDAIHRKYQIARDEIIDFSGNINPLGVSAALKEGLSKNLDLIATYPDQTYMRLRESIADYTATSPAYVIVGNGSTELISLAIHLLHPKKALIIGPTYSEYEREISLLGGSSHYYRLKEELDFQLEVSDLLQQLTDDIDLFVVCNPNNPTGSSLYARQLRQILDHCKEKDIFVMVDETYAEFSDHLEDITATTLIPCYNNILVLRGISKFFAAPGLRLGYGICGNKDLMHRMDTLKNPWTINILASFAGEIMFQDLAYIQRTKNLIAEERIKIYQELVQWEHIKVYPTSANFILIKLLSDHISASAIYDHCIQKKMLIRDASSFPFLNDRFLRFCFLLPEQNQALLTELKYLIC